MLKLKIKIEETEIDHFTCLEEHIEPCYDLGETDPSDRLRFYIYQADGCGCGC